MISICREYLKACLKQVGIKIIYTTKTDASKHQVIPFGEIGFEDSVLRPDGSLVARYEGPGDHERTFRRRTYQRTEQARIKVVHRDQALAENTRDDLLTLLAGRIDDGHGNAVLITAWNSEGEEDSSILRQGAAAYIDVKFDGGIYQDNTVKLCHPETDLRLDGEICEEV